MASLIIYPPGAGEAQVVSLDRRVVQIGTSLENDLVLPEGSGEPHHAHILYEKGEYTLICPSKAHAALVAGKRRKSHRLSDGEVFELGDCLLRFVLYDQGIQASDEATGQDAGESYFRSLHGFAQKLMATYEVSTLLETLLDELIALTGADKAFLLLIEDGVLTRWLLNMSSARQLGLEPNGFASGGFGSIPGVGTSNVHIEAGEKSAEMLMKEAGKGLLVTDMFGPSINPNTGDYSVGVAGFWFEDGAVQYPVSEVTIAGDLPSMFARLVPASDLEFRGRRNAPSVMIEDMSIAGN